MAIDEAGERAKWLESLQAGDMVIIQGSGGNVRFSDWHYRAPRRAYVSKVTKTQIVIASGDRYKRDTGRKIGDSFEKIEPVTYAALQERQAFINRMRLREIEKRGLDACVFDAMLAAYDSMQRRGDDAS